jgi:hypothetical protein
MYFLTHLKNDDFNGNKYIQDIIINQIPNIVLIDYKQPIIFKNTTIILLHPQLMSQSLLNKNNKIIIIFHDNYVKFMSNCQKKYKSTTFLNHNIIQTELLLLQLQVLSKIENITNIFLNKNDKEFYKNISPNSYLLKYHNSIIMNKKIYTDSKIINLIYTGSSNYQNLEYVTQVINFVKNENIINNYKIILNICGKICNLINFCHDNIKFFDKYDKLTEFNFENPIGINNNYFQTGISTKNLNFMENKLIIFSHVESKLDFANNYPIYYFNDIQEIKCLIIKFQEIKNNYPKIVNFNYDTNYINLSELK